VCATARVADGVVGIVGCAVACDQHEISVVKGNFRVVHVRDGDIGDERLAGGESKRRYTRCLVRLHG
jgi:hypothetical protein